MKWREKVESIAPFLAGSVAAAAHFFSGIGTPSSPEIFNSVTNLCGITVGFMGTAQGILLSMENNRLVISLKEMKQFVPLIEHFSSAIHWCVVTAVMSLIASLGISNTGAGAPTGFMITFPFLTSIWCFVTFGAGCSSFMAINWFSRLAKLMSAR